MRPRVLIDGQPRALLTEFTSTSGYGIDNEQRRLYQLIRGLGTKWGSTRPGIPLRAQPLHTRRPGIDGAERSQQRFAGAQKAERFAAEIVGIEVKGQKGPWVFATDEANRPDTTLDMLAKLKPAVRKDRTITAGNSPGLNSGAAAVVVAERRFAEQSGLRPIARLGVRRRCGGARTVQLGPVPAVRRVLARALEPRGRGACRDQ